MKEFLKLHYLSISLVAVLFITIVVFVPLHMDEFLMFHPIACLEQSQQLNRYRESCDAYGTQLFGLNFNRAYSIVGISSSIISLPFFWLVNSIWTNYFIGAIFCILISFGLIKSFGLSNKYLVISLSYFPITFALIRDGGPVRLSMLAIAWSPFIIGKYLEARSIKQFAWLSLLTALWMLSTEDKPFFIYLIPGIIFLSLSSVLKQKDLYFVRANLTKICLAVAVSSFFSIFLLVLLRVGSTSYLEFLLSNSPASSLGFSLFGQRNIFQVFQDLSFLTIIIFIFFWPYFSHRTTDFAFFHLGKFDIPYPGTQDLNQKVSSLFYLVNFISVATIYILVLSKLKFKKEHFKIIFLLISSLLFSFGALLAGGWAVHHFSFLHIPIAVLVLLSIEKNFDGFLRRFVLPFATLSAAISVVFAPPILSSSNEINIVYKKAMAFANQKSYFVCASWGCFYQYSLINSGNIPVLFVTPEAPQYFKALEQDVVASDKNVYLICANCSKSSIEVFFPRLSVEYIPTNTKNWNLYFIIPKVDN